jgi:hypothetical protein
VKRAAVGSPWSCGICRDRRQSTAALGLFLFFHKRLCGPLANSRFHNQPDLAHRPNSGLDAAYHKADKAIETIVDLLAACSRLPSLRPEFAIDVEHLRTGIRQWPRVLKVRHIKTIRATRSSLLPLRRALPCPTHRDDTVP